MESSRPPFKPDSHPDLSDEKETPPILKRKSLSEKDRLSISLAIDKLLSVQEQKEDEEQTARIYSHAERWLNLSKRASSVNLQTLKNASSSPLIAANQLCLSELPLTARNPDCQIEITPVTLEQADRILRPLSTKEKQNFHTLFEMLANRRGLTRNFIHLTIQNGLAIKPILQGAQVLQRENILLQYFHLLLKRPQDAYHLAQGIVILKTKNKLSDLCIEILMTHEGNDLQEYVNQLSSLPSRTHTSSNTALGLSKKLPKRLSLFEENPYLLILFKYFAKQKYFREEGPWEYLCHYYYKETQSTALFRSKTSSSAEAFDFQSIAEFYTKAKEEKSLASETERKNDAHWAHLNKQLSERPFNPEGPFATLLKSFLICSPNHLDFISETIKRLLNIHPHRCFSSRARLQIVHDCVLSIKPETNTKQPSQIYPELFTLLTVKNQMRPTKQALIHQVIVQNLENLCLHESSFVKQVLIKQFQTKDWEEIFYGFISSKLAKNDFETLALVINTLEYSLSPDQSFHIQQYALGILNQASQEPLESKQNPPESFEEKLPSKTTHAKYQNKKISIIKAIRKIFAKQNVFLEDALLHKLINLANHPFQAISFTALKTLNQLLPKIPIAKQTLVFFKTRTVLDKHLNNLFKMIPNDSREGYFLFEFMQAFSRKLDTRYRSSIFHSLYQIAENLKSLPEVNLLSHLLRTLDAYSEQTLDLLPLFQYWMQIGFLDTLFLFDNVEVFLTKMNDDEIKHIAKLFIFHYTIHYSRALYKLFQTDYRGYQIRERAAFLKNPESKLGRYITLELLNDPELDFETRNLRIMIAVAMFDLSAHLPTESLQSFHMTMTGFITKLELTHELQPNHMAIEPDLYAKIFSALLPQSGHPCLMQIFLNLAQRYLNIMNPNTLNRPQHRRSRSSAGSLSSLQLRQSRALILPICKNILNLFNANQLNLTRIWLQQHFSQEQLMNLMLNQDKLGTLSSLQQAPWKIEVLRILWELLTPESQQEFLRHLCQMLNLNLSLENYLQDNEFRILKQIWSISQTSHQLFCIDNLIEFYQQPASIGKGMIAIYELIQIQSNIDLSCFLSRFKNILHCLKKEDPLNTLFIHLSIHHLTQDLTEVDKNYYLYGLLYQEITEAHQPLYFTKLIRLFLEITNNRELASSQHLISPTDTPNITPSSERKIAEVNFGVPSHLKFS